MKRQNLLSVLVLSALLATTCSASFAATLPDPHTTVTHTNNQSDANNAYDGVTEDTSQLNFAYAVDGSGGATDVYVKDGGTITVKNTGSTTTTNDGYARSSALNGSTTIHAGTDASKKGTVNVVSTSTGTNGLDTTNLSGTTGSTAIRSYATAYGANAEGINKNVIDGNANIAATATGGSNITTGNASTSANPQTQVTSYAESVGLRGQNFGSNTIKGDATITSTATGGSDLKAGYGSSNAVGGKAYAYVDGYAHAKGMYQDGVGTNRVDGNANITATATGGSNLTANNAGGTTVGLAYANGSAEAAGMSVDAGGKNSVGGNAVIHVTSQGGDNVTGGHVSGTSTVDANAKAYAHGYGMSATAKGGRNTINGDAVIDVTATGGANTVPGTMFTNYAKAGIDSSALAYGMNADNGGVNTIKGNAFITTKAEAKMAGEEFHARSLNAANGGVNNVNRITKVKQLKGDVYATDNGTNNLTLDTADSYLEGNIVSENGGTNNVTVTHGATWRPVYDNRYGTDCVADSDANAATTNVASNTVTDRSVDSLTLEDEGKADLTWDGWNEDHSVYTPRTTYRTLTVDKLSGNNGVFVVDTDLANDKSDVINVGTGSTSMNAGIRVNYDPFFESGSDLSQGLSGKAKVVGTSPDGMTFTGETGEYNEYVYVPTLEKENGNWYITDLTSNVNLGTGSTQSASGTAKKLGAAGNTGNSNTPSSSDPSKVTLTNTPFVLSSSAIADPNATVTASNNNSTANDPYGSITVKGAANTPTYGVDGTNGSTDVYMTNGGTISATNTGNAGTPTNAQAEADAINGDTVIDVENVPDNSTGTVTLDSTATSADNLDGTTLAGLNTSVNGATVARGMNAATGKTNTINGNANITATAKSGDNMVGGTTSTVSTSSDLNAYANSNATSRGLAAAGSGSNTINGNANIVATATAGNNTRGGSGNSGNVQENVNSFASAVANAIGAYAHGASSNTINGNATITVSATGGDSATGGYAHSNSDTGNASAHADADATGLLADNSSSNHITGNAVINVTAKAGDDVMGGQSFGTTANSDVSSYAHAYGVHVADKGSNTIDGDTTINVTAQGSTGAMPGTMFSNQAPGSITSNNTLAYGVASTGGTNTLKGNTYITTNAIQGDEGVAFHARSVYADKGTNDLTATGKTKQLEGDIYATGGGTNNIVLDTKDSYLQGNIVTNANSANNLTVANGATYRPVYDNRYGTDCVDDRVDDNFNDPTYAVDDRTVDHITLENGGTVDLTWDGWNADHTTYTSRDLNTNRRSFTVNNLSGNDGVFTVDTDLANNLSDKINVGAASTATDAKIRVNYDPFFANSSNLGDTLSGKAEVVSASPDTLAFSGALGEYNENVFVPTLAKENGKWYVTDLTLNGIPADSLTSSTPKPSDPSNPSNPVPPYVPAYSTNTMAAADSVYNANSLWYASNNAIDGRVSDLRNGAGLKNGKHDAGIWANYQHGTLKNGKGRTAELQYNQFNIGIDKHFTNKDNDHLYRGVMVSHTTGDSTYDRGTGDASGTMAGLYQTWLGNKGHFYDVSLKYGKLRNSYDVTDLSDHYSKADYDAWALTLNGNYGRRMALGKYGYFEPSAGFILGRIGSTDYTTSKNMHVSTDSINHAIGRVGFQVGTKLNKFSPYFKAHYYHDFAGNPGIQTGRISYRTDLPKNWFEVGVGSKFQINEQSSAYVELMKTFDDLQSNLGVRVGAEWKF